MNIAYDLHLHSCLSPCGDGDMTPSNLVNMALLAGLDCIALTDHNSSLNCPAIIQAARRLCAGQGTQLQVIPGMELCTAEEIHVVCLFPSLEAALSFSRYIRTTLPPVKNRPDIFGEQLILDEHDAVIGQEELLLTTASSVGIDAVPALMKEYGGAAFPAHIDRPSYSVTAALGDFPAVGFAVAEATAKADVEELRRRYPAVSGLPLLLSSDAHYLEQVQEAGPWLELPDREVKEKGVTAAVVAAAAGEIPCRWGRTAE
ncbi:MAG: PHP domain-containing protein [Clostridiales bacterium]|nr:PHP domain-containing protein [Clostridiales bacterium]